LSWPATGAPRRGYAIASRRIEKVFSADEHLRCRDRRRGRPRVELVRLFQTQLEHYEKIEGEPLSLEGKAEPARPAGAQATLPAAMQGFVVIPLFAGYDERRDRGRVFSFDVTGGNTRRPTSQTNGSGGVHARNWIKDPVAPRTSPATTPSTSPCGALFAAADEDSATGGPTWSDASSPTVRE